MTPSISACSTESVGGSPSDTAVHRLDRIEIADVREAYRKGGIRVDHRSLVVVGLDDVQSACPIYALAHYWDNVRAVVLLAISRNSHDPGGCVRLGELLGLHPDYLRGHMAAWFGKVLPWDSVAEREGWRDGMKCWVDLAASPV